MKLPEHVDLIRTGIEKSFDKLFSRLGLTAKAARDMDSLPAELHNKRRKIDNLINSHLSESGLYASARAKALDELTFTLFNRLAAMKVIENHGYSPESITKRSEHGERSFNHKAWLEENPNMRNEELEGIREFIKQEFNQLGEHISLYAKEYPYALLPDATTLNDIIDTFNAVEKDPQIGEDIWKNDDILGWLYESYNNPKKKAHKDSKAKTEYHKVSIQSQVYTPRWVVQFLVDNSLGKLYLEMYPDSEIKEKYAIANAPTQQVRAIKPLNEIKLIDPATGSGNFLLYAFDLFYDLYIDQIENYDADYEEDEIPRLIIEHNLYGIDLDDRAAQLAQLGLYIKAKQKRLRQPIRQFNVVSSDFYLPDYEEVKSIFDNEENPLVEEQRNLVQDIWADLQQAYRFGSLVRIGEKVNQKLEIIKSGVTIGKKGMADMFASQEIVHFEIFKAQFFMSLEKAVAIYAQDNGENFLSSKTRDAITYLKILTGKYDVATANPPYTDSSDFGVELKKFIGENYKKDKFHTNLYATFIKRSVELTNENGYLALVHPPTFMYIKSFEGVREYILNKMHIDTFVDWGYLGMFNPAARVDSCMYILSKTISEVSTFIRLSDIYEGKRKSFFDTIYQNLIENIENNRIYIIPQSKFKSIISFPFIYWISDAFRKTFSYKSLGQVMDVAQGLVTGLNDRFVRFHWEVSKDLISEVTIDENKWVFYPKGGEFKKWFGNNVLVVNWEEDGKEIKEFKDDKGKVRSRPQNEELYFKKGITYSSSGSKGTSFRFLSENQIISGGGPGVMPKDDNSIYYPLAFLNSKLAFYIINCFNPTVNTTQGDLKRIPFILQSSNNEIKKVDKTSEKCVNIQKYISQFSFVENNYKDNPIEWSREENSAINKISQFIKFYLNEENHLNTQTILYEAIINELIFSIYSLTPDDKNMVIEKEGNSIGNLPVSIIAAKKYVEYNAKNETFKLDELLNHINNLNKKDFSTNEKNVIINEFSTLYQSNNGLEEFCIRHQVNPINVWYWFKESNISPPQRTHDITMEFLADMIRELLQEDEDGIIPLVENAGEEILYNQIERRFQEKGFSSAQLSSIDKLIGRSLPDYLNGHFFKDLSNHLNLFPNLPKTPFIWHLSSGKYRGFDCYVLIYKWNKDRLMSLKSVYLEKRERALTNKQMDMEHNNSPKAQSDKELIRNQLRELKEFKAKIDELLSEGYDPKLDDGVGKNIAPLQAKGMLTYEVLNPGQLKKYLNADW